MYRDRDATVCAEAQSGYISDSTCKATGWTPGTPSKCEARTTILYVYIRHLYIHDDAMQCTSTHLGVLVPESASLQVKQMMNTNISIQTFDQSHTI